MSLSSNMHEYAVKDEMSLDIVNDMQALFALWEATHNANGDVDLRLLSANKFFLNVLGLTAEEVNGRLFSEIGSNDKAWISVLVDIALGKEDTKTVETYSAEVNLHFHSQFYSPKHGQLVTVHNNRTPFVKSDAEQEERENKISSLFQLMPSGFAICDLIYDENNKPIDVYFNMLNNTFEIMCGFRVGSIQGKQLLDEYPDYPTDLFDIFDSVVKNKEKATFMMQTPNKDRIYEVVCYSQGEKRFLNITNDITERAQAEKELKEAHATILSSIEYSSKIQKNLLPWHTVFEQAFLDYSIIWEPRDVVGGDIYWLKCFEDGVLLSVCDCTGHGTPGALLTMLVASTFDTIVNESNCTDTAQIMYLLDRQISAVLNAKVSGERKDDGIRDGCDLAVLYVAMDGSVTISSGNTHVFICDGKDVTQIKGQRLFIGEGSVKSKDDVRIINIPANQDNKFYVASDGLYDQLGGEPRRPFGYKEFKRIILENHNEKQAVISEKIWEAFECHKGKLAQRDDVELITFKP